MGSAKRNADRFLPSLLLPFSLYISFPSFLLPFLSLFLCILKALSSLITTSETGMQEVVFFAHPLTRPVCQQTLWKSSLGLIPAGPRYTGLEEELGAIASEGS